MFLALATGGVGAFTVTTAVAVPTLPLSSVTVKVTVFAPTLLQLNEVLLRLRLLIVQLSWLPLLISLTAILAELLLFKVIKMFLVITTGRVVSLTVTVA